MTGRLRQTQAQIKIKGGQNEQRCNTTQDSQGEADLETLRGSEQDLRSGSRAIHKARRNAARRGRQSGGRHESCSSVGNRQLTTQGEDKEEGITIDTPRRTMRIASCANAEVPISSPERRKVKQRRRARAMNDMTVRRDQSGRSQSCSRRHSQRAETSRGRVA